MKKLVICCSYFLLTTANALAQITPDRTLPINSTVNQNLNQKIIEGGTVRGVISLQFND